MVFRWIASSFLLAMTICDDCHGKLCNEHTGRWDVFWGCKYAARVREGYFGGCKACAWVRGGCKYHARVRAEIIGKKYGKSLEFEISKSPYPPSNVEL